MAGKKTTVAIMSKLDVQLKESTTEDIPTLIDIATQAYREHYPYLWKDKGEGYIKNSYNPTAFAKEIEDKTVELYLTQVNGEDYGFFKVNVNAALQEFSAAEAMEIQRIYFVQKATGKGLGKAVMKRIEIYARKLNKKVVWLKVMDSSPAITFYEKCGYGVVGETQLEVEGIYTKYQRQLIMQKILL